MMMNHACDLDGSKVVLFRKNPDGRPRQRRASGDGPRSQVLTTNVGLQIPAGLTFDDWERAGRQLSGIVNSSSWWLGDWLVYGKDHYTDRYQLGIRAAGLQYQTLRNYAWVSRRFELHRRRSGLTFQHHAELASLSVREQDLWLDRAEQTGWTTKQLRNAIRLTREDERNQGKQVEATRQLAVPGNRLQWWHKAAEQSGIDFEQWVLATLDNAAERALEETEEQAGLSA
ncbi:LmbU family transcriptional regulator [Streptomyces sp. yr375]|uniref:LmbU family transcriptional regulator n=1 Tax=Streptomyces sp. yr375 TaxID=1761906 RepID=UPI000B8263AF|nr:LmbU family transcriptional regulator [Streptomyces sp. yr375]